MIFRKIFGIATEVQLTGPHVKEKLCIGTEIQAPIFVIGEGGRVDETAAIKLSALVLVKVVERKIKFLFFGG